ncbi:MarR family winged helix-turn-helix transcriptional regulator [Paenibacillus chungangensis]|uniref:MarR family winged helix-turn-helix transcriptional regulator n=1 Tax=Paenibacillus chungangensis TaxID=696535 RepID=A0ABW3HTF6_9BACL
MKHPLSDHIGVLIHMIDLEIVQYMKERLSSVQLTPEQHLIIALLLKRQGLMQNEIAEALSKDKSSLTRMLGSLETKGFITRQCCGDDRRAMKVFLTEKGMLLQDHVDEVDKSTRAIMLRGFSEAECAELARLLLKLRDNVRDEQRSMNHLDAPEG